MLDDKEEKKKGEQNKENGGEENHKRGGGRGKKQQPKHIYTQPSVGSNMHSQPAELAMNETDYFRGKKTQTV